MSSRRKDNRAVIECGGQPYKWRLDAENVATQVLLTVSTAPDASARDGVLALKLAQPLAE